jgi:endonuclease/exonuclease/phosphatase family metal-dependent hydrolase
MTTNGGMPGTSTIASVDDEDTSSALSTLAATTRAFDEALLREPARASAEMTLKICSWNVQLLPGIWNGCGGCPKDLMQRVQRIVQNLRIVAKSCALDVVCLQEVFYEPAKVALRDALRDVFPFAYAPNHGTKSGLMIFTKMSHVCNHFSPLTGTGMERVAFTKGVTTTFCRLNSDVTGSADVMPVVALILNTHLQSDYWSKSHATRREQLYGIDKVIRRALRECEGNGYVVDRIICCGDLNVVAGSAEYFDMTRGPFAGAIDLMAPPSDLYDDLSTNEDRMTFPVAKWRHYILACRGPNRYLDLRPTCRLDYILDVTPTFQSHGVPPVHKHVDSGYVHHLMCRDAHGMALSDHFPIIAFSSTFHFHGGHYSL